MSKFVDNAPAVGDGWITPPCHPKRAGPKLDLVIAGGLNSDERRLYENGFTH